MRELLLRNNKDKRHSELFLSEHFEKAGIVQEIEKKTIYRVKEILEFTDLFDLELFLERKKEQIAARQKFIIRHRSGRAGTEKFIYKVVGDQYVVLNDKVVILKVSQCVKKLVVNKNKSENLVA